MNTTLNSKLTKIPSLLLALVLQLAPIARALPPVSQLFASTGMAIVFRWAVGAVAAFGAFDAVSGASTVITSPLTATGTNGVAFSYRITTGPQVATSFTASPLPPGLTVSTTTGKITGTPTATGVTLVNLQGCDGGNGCTPVAVLTLTIVAGGGGGATAPAITTQPASKSVTAGSSVTFSVVATGTAPLTYQWRFNGANISGATSSSYTISSAQAANAGTYSVVVSNSAGSVTSANATLTVSAVATAPSITTQPVSQTVAAGASVTFSVAATGTAPLTYQWRFNGANISGATSSSYTISSAQAANAGTYSVVVANSAGNATSANATLTVGAAVAPTITRQPSSGTAQVGTNVSFTCEATGTAPLTYQWRFNGVNIAGATNTLLVILSVTAANTGQYSCVVANPVGSVISASATLTVVPATGSAPTITRQPSSGVVSAGTNVSFTCEATGTAPLTYQWRFNGVNIAGATNTLLVILSVTAANTGQYSCVVANPVGTVTSSAATLTVQTSGAIAPTITRQPSSGTAEAGQAVSFSVTATGTAPLRYQWRYNGANIYGANSSLLVLSGVTTAQTGRYSCVVANAAGSVTSASAALTVVNDKAGTIGNSAVAALRGNYRGLFYATNSVAYASSGFLAMSFDNSGAITGSVDVAAGHFGFAGQFDSNGHTTIQVVRAGKKSLNIDMQLDLANNKSQITGSVSDGTWNTQLWAESPPSNQASAFAGTYHVVISDHDSESDDAAEEFGTAIVNAQGGVQFNSVLPDGTHLAQTVTLSSSGEWPAYFGIDATRGAMLGWLGFTATPSLSGKLFWVRPGQAPVEVTVSGAPVNQTSGTGN